MVGNGNRSSALYGGIEAGGTKFVCGIGTGPDDLRTTSFPTTTPEETIGQAIRFFQDHQRQHPDCPLSSIGIAAFGPVELSANSPKYGYITSTPKTAWVDTDLAGSVGAALGVPVGFDTDVNGAALGEHRWGATQGLDTFIYLTIGTGVGGGGLVRGRPMHGLLHPEMGHILISHDRDADPYPGNCPYHGDCLEGLACGPAVEARWGAKATSLPPNHPAWALEARYLALALVNFICTLSPQRIILGGGIMKQAHLFPMVRRGVQELLNGYLQAPEITEDIESYIVPPKLEYPGVLGAIVLAEQVTL